MSDVSCLEFKGKWRSYQKRVLDELNFHLADDKLNVVAAPGAGKTTLGIEVMRRLGKSALILAPTITIKSQWKQRIIDNFLDSAPDVGFISDDIENMGIITISTYQNIHSLYKEAERRENFFLNLKRRGVKTLVLDEAHHLRTEWYSTLHNLCDKLKSSDFKIVSLTGTPPYDVSPAEWNNYNTLCGSVDAEISIPELVKAGDLCPHQDLIYFSDLTSEETRKIIEFKERRAKFFEYINNQSDFLYSLEACPFINDMDNNIELLYQNIDFTLALVSYLLNNDSMHLKANYIAEFLGTTTDKLTDFTYSKAEILFNGILSKFKEYFKHTGHIKNKLKELKLINGNKVDLTGRIDFEKLAARSQNKLNAIADITKFEYKNINNSLREVVLLDYIGKGDSEGLNILSVFEKLYPLNISLGILTGTLIVIPASAKEALYQILKNKNISFEKVLTTEFKHNYLRVETFGRIDIVSVTTELFEAGYMNVLIGTAALLGEGWDSPCVNTLVIASVVGSFMLSNQMRGRALRIDKKNPDKTSNIWHLVSLEISLEETSDMQTVQKRFKTFEGISYNKVKRIQNGIDRLGLNLNNFDTKILNKTCLEYAKSRNDLKNKWRQVFNQSVITEQKIAPLVYDVIEGTQNQSSIITTVPQWCSFAQNLIEASSTFDTTKKKNFLNKTILKLAHCFGWICDDYEPLVMNNYKICAEQIMFENFAKCLLRTLCDINIIKTNFNDLELKVNKQINADFYLTLLGCTNYERNIFIKAFEEIFRISQNYRYILKSGDKYLGVPNVIGTKSKNVKLFVKYLEQEFLFYEMIFTRNPQGYKELLRARYNTVKTSEIRDSRVWI